MIESKDTKKDINTSYTSSGKNKGKYNKLIKSDKIEPFRRTVIKNKIQPRMKYQNMNATIDKASIDEIHGKNDIKIESETLT